MEGCAIIMASSLFSIPEPTPFNELLSLAGKTAIVTGGGRGLGKQVVRRFSEAGANVVFCARHEDHLEAVENEFADLPGTLKSVTADVSLTVDRQRLIDTAISEFGGIDILVNCAAIYPPGNSLSVDEKTWDAMHDIDTKAPFFLTQSVAKTMIEQHRAGRIINFLSTAFVTAAPMFSAYAIAKAGLWEMTRVLSTELASHRITVNAVTPGSTLTEEKAAALASGNVPDALGIQVTDDMKAFFAQVMETGGIAQMMKQRMPMGRMGFPDDLAKAVLFLASDMGAYVTGQNIVVSGAQAENNIVLPSAPDAEADEAPEAVSPLATNSTEPDSGLDGIYRASVDTPMGTQEIELDLHTSGTDLSGTMVFMGKRIDIQRGAATQTGFAYDITVKTMLKKMEAHIQGTRDGDTVSGTIANPMGTFKFEGSRAE